MFSRLKKLKEAGVVGINSRNLEYIAEHNPRKLYPLADNKIRTKLIAKEAGISVPELYGVVSSVGEAKKLKQILGSRREFVIKPSQGCGGEGIVVVSDVRDNEIETVARETLSFSDLEHHVANILHGLFSLGSRPDKAMIEYRVRFDPIFDDISSRGVPDIRIVSFLGVPVMAMLRLPTLASGGKANLHQGAIGAGVDIATGRTLSGVWYDSVVMHHPDSQANITGRQIPHWNKLLELAAKSYQLTGLGYQGVDIVLDEELGPMLLELNTRPGLAVQIANQAGLKKRLVKVEQNISSLNSIEEKVNFSISSFASQKESASD